MWSACINRHRADHPFRFSDLLLLQQRELARIRGSSESVLLFAEVPSTLTLGARQMLHLPEHLRVLAAEGCEMVAGERGGNETWHGPGQWVGFVLTPLESFTGDARGVRKAVHGILDRLLPLVQEYRKEARIDEGDRLGIWSASGKIASIGIKIREGYTSSGFALNCLPHPQAFFGIDPCGIRGSQPDFLLRDIEASRRETEFEAIPHKILQKFETL